MSKLPPRLLEDVYWSFAEPVPASPDAFIEAARDYAADVETQDPSAQLRRPLPFSDVRILYSYGYRAESGEWQDRTNEVLVVASLSEPLTGAALLWELHVACQATVGEDDHHFFEGLELVSAATAGQPPVYEIMLGS